MVYGSASKAGPFADHWNGIQSPNSSRRPVVPIVLALLLVLSVPLTFRAGATGPTLTSNFATVAPAVDGIVGFGEWSTTSRVSFAHGFVTVLNDNVRLYILIDVTGDTVNDPPLTSNPWGDFFYVAFDVNRDSAVTPNVDLLYGTAPGTYNLRYSYFLGGGFFSGLQPSTRSSLAAGFGCFFGDGSLSFSFPGGLRCSSHRVWELGIDLAEIGARAGGATRMGIRAYSQNPSFIDDTPANFLTDFTNLVEVPLAAPPVPVPSPTPGASVTLASIPEITQAIATRSGGVDRAAQKPTAARVYAQVAGASVPQPVIAYLYGTSGTSDLPGSPLALLYNAPVTVNRDQTSSTANLLLPRSWTTGPIIQVRAMLRDLNGRESSLPGWINVTFTPMRVPSYQIIPVNTGTATSPILVSNTEIASQESYLATIYPVASVSFNVLPWQTIGVQTGDPIPALNAYYTGLQIGCRGDPACLASLPDVVYGFTPSGGGLSDPVWGGGAGRVARGYRGSSREGTMAHEINHDLDRSTTGTWGRHVADPNCNFGFDPGPTPPAGCSRVTTPWGTLGGSNPNWGCGAAGPDPNWPVPPNDDHIRETGFDTRSMAAVRATTPDVMSYCQSGTLPTKWISIYRWQNLFSTFPAPAAVASVLQAATLSNIYYISGHVTASGTGQLDPIFLQPGASDQPSGTPNYCIKVLDAQRKPVLSFPFQADFVDSEGNPRDTAFFNLRVPAPSTGAIIELQKLPSTTLFTIVRSMDSPVVTVLSPNGGESWTGSPVAINWTASDKNKDPLTYLIQYSPDNGTMWVPLASGLKGTSYIVDPSSLPGGNGGRIRVVASDGFNNGEDVSDGPFTVSGKPPEVQIIAPGADAVVNPGDLITFRGDATDLEDRSIPDTSIVWSDGDTYFGMGREVQAVLPSGTHVITLTAVDSSGQTALARAKVVVSGSSSNPPLSLFPYPFANQGCFNLTMVVALSQPHAPAGAASTIDVVAAVPVAASMTSSYTQCFPFARLDVEAAVVTSTGITVTDPRNIISFGGRGVNWVTRYYNDLPGATGPPVRFFPGMGVCTTDSIGVPVHCYRLSGIYGNGTKVVDYGYTSMLVDSAGRTVMIVAGLSGYATRAEGELIALRAGTVLTGTGTITQLVDFNGDGKYETFQVIDGTGPFVPMAPSLYPSPGPVAETFSIGLSQPHGVAAAASTIDVVGGIPLSVREARLRGGRIWAALDIELADPSGTAINPSVGDLVALGGRGVNLVTRYYNDNRISPVYVVPGSGVTADGVNFFRASGSYGLGTPVKDFGYRGEGFDPSLRHFMIVAGLSGFATRGACILVAWDAGTMTTGKGTISSLLDDTGDGHYEEFQVLAGAGGVMLMPSPLPFPPY